MKIFLTLKNWQLFLIMWGVPIALDIYAFTDPQLLVKLFPVIMAFFVVGSFGWIWAISTELHAKLPADVKLNVGSFKIYFMIPIVYLIVVMFFLNKMFLGGPTESGEPTGVGAWVGGLIAVHLVSMVCIFLGMRFAAKTMKSIELGRMAKFNDYAGEFFLIWFSIFGVWILQPRLNKLVSSSLFVEKGKLR